MNNVEIMPDETLLAQKPLVSVVVPAFNAATFISRCLESINSQTYRPLEVIVVDDCSSDDTCAYVESLNSENITLVRLNENCGASHARNIGIQHARGKYIAFLDADDSWRPNKLSLQIPLLEKDPEVVLIGCNFQYVTEGRLGSYFFEKYPPPETCIYGAWKILLEYSFIQTSCAVVRKDILDKIKLFDEELIIAEDQDLWIRLSYEGKVGVVHEALAEFFDTPGSLNKRELIRVTDCMLPMIEGHIKENWSRLTWREIHGIRGRRNYSAGESVFTAGYYCKCISYFAKSICYGYRPMWASMEIIRSLLLCVTESLKKVFC